jgi:dCTP deaminase
MSNPSDRRIREVANGRRMIDFLCEPRVREGAINYGVSSQRHALRVSGKFKILSNVKRSLIEAKAFAVRSFTSIQAEPVNGRLGLSGLSRCNEQFCVPSDVLTICVGKSTNAVAE